jgi:hypothetical protein
MAYVLLCAVRRIGLHHTPFAKASCGTIRLTVEDRRTRSHQCAPHKDRDGVRLPCGCYLGRCGPPSQCRGQSASLTRLTRGAATRTERSTTLRQTGTPAGCVR